jgi:hypothetical protein
MSASIADSRSLSGRIALSSVGSADSPEDVPEDVTALM